MWPCAEGTSAHGHGGNHHPLWQSLRLAPAQPQATAGLFQYRTCRVFDDGDRCNEPEWLQRHSLLPGRLSLYRDHLHGHHSGHAAHRRRRHHSAGSTAPESPGLAGVLSLAMVSLAGIPPLAGVLRKFLLFKAVLEQASVHSAYYLLVAIAIIGVVISLVYYLGVPADSTGRNSSWCLRDSRFPGFPIRPLGLCGADDLSGDSHNRLLEAANAAVESLKL